MCAGSPFKFNVTNVNHVVAKGHGLSRVVCRQPASFTVSTSSAAGAAFKLQDLDVCILGSVFVIVHFVQVRQLIFSAAYALLRLNIVLVVFLLP